VASRLGLYWYYRGMMVEARQWQERAAAAEGDPVDRAVVRLMLGGSLAMANRRDLALPHIEDGWAIGGAAPTERLGEALGILAGALFVAGDAGLGARNTALVAAAATATADPTVGLLARLAAVLSTAATAAPADVLAGA
jgi:hypothetical protein